MVLKIVFLKVGIRKNIVEKRLKKKYNGVNVKIYKNVGEKDLLWKLIFQHKLDK